ncbi:MAG: 4-hydroxythreonine-4-phosphate dehydrogenase PdxA [Bacteroidales bacterium]|nr:4-hydroxythreonine-4-phosphate dehydrogenase PdxA [Bacteroidales bacterium]MBN2761893.1 4-hydroxythreonine-4-phosphate dehydrogenase PdxA [Bacteroidales bacterium]
MSHKNRHTPVLAVTMGDPAGIGPEIAAKVFAGNLIYDICRPVLIGHAATMREAVKTSGLKLLIRTIDSIDEAVYQPGTLDLIEVGANITEPVSPGKISAEAGEIAFRAVKKAIELNMQGKTHGTVTGPVNKEAINKAGHNFSGHTEIFAHYTHARKYAMLLIDDNLRIIHATTHVSLREACNLIRKERILEVIQLLDAGLQKLGFANPLIGVAGLNPHSGDGGLFGTEEIEEIQPAIEEARAMGINVDGPVPADTLFALARGGRYDGCVAMYHDQGHIPFKLLGFTWDKKKNTMQSVRGVNITLGLPIVRTSVDHGTAFEIAGKGLASADALGQAIEYACKLAN